MAVVDGDGGGIGGASSGLDRDVVDGAEAGVVFVVVVVVVAYAVCFIEKKKKRKGARSISYAVEVMGRKTTQYVC